MKNNENQNIRTNFKADDVFKPDHANQLAKSIHYDFIITQDMFTNFVKKQFIQQGSVVDIGQVISSLSDGSSGSWMSKIPAPVSIYISANTAGYRLNFSSNLITGQNAILDVSSFMDNNQFTRSKTVDMVNVYSAYPYEVYPIPTTGFNLWTTINAPVIISSDNRTGGSGTCKIGYYDLKAPCDLGSNTNVCIVSSNAIGQYKFTQSPFEEQVSDGTYTPAVVFANWMAGQGVVTEYEINTATASVPGLYQSMWSTRHEYACDITLVEHDQTSQHLYYLSHYDSNMFLFTDASTGNTVSVDTNGIITRSAVLRATSGRVTIFELGLNNDPSKYSTVGLASVLTEYGNQISILRPEIHSFLTIAQDVDSSGETWYSYMHPFKFMSTTTLDIYTWYGITRKKIQGGVEVEYNGQNNTQSAVYVDFNTLIDGVVYEINVHILKLPVDSTTIEGEGTVGTQYSPYDEHLDAPLWGVYFISDGNYKNYNRWGITGVGGKQSSLAAPYTWYPSNTKPESLGSATKLYRAISELAYASLRFVRLGTEIFVMNY